MWTRVALLLGTPIAHAPVFPPLSCTLVVVVGRLGVVVVVTVGGTARTRLVVTAQRGQAVRRRQVGEWRPTRSRDLSESPERWDSRVQSVGKGFLEGGRSCLAVVEVSR